MDNTLQALRHRANVASLTILAFALGSAGCNKSKDADSNGATSAAASAAGTLDTLPRLLDGFEGEIDVMAKDADKPDQAPVNVAVMIKSGKVRLDLPEQVSKSGPFGANAKGYGIFDAAAKKIDLVLDPMKEVLVIDLTKSAEQFKGLGARPRPDQNPEHGGAPATPPKVTKTGKYDTVAGYKCENWDVTSDHRQATVCVVDEGFSWFQIPMTGIPTEHLWMAELLDGKHFPLRFISYGADGKEERRVEATKVEKKTIDPTLFQLPPGYQIIDMAQMLGAFARPPGAGMPMMPPGMPGMPGAPGASGMAGMPMPRHK